MVMVHELTHCSSERRFADEDDPVETGFLDGADESCRVTRLIEKHQRSQRGTRSSFESGETWWCKILVSFTAP